ncbi:MAG: hypothetical protein GX758_01890, partial [Tenericutes bacterium]|nr:hypothetical protein [Mycoplasmatota bacterium]
ELANTYNIKVNEIPELKDNLEMITLLKEKLEDNLDSVVFIKTATEILEKEELKDLLLKNDSEEIKAHISKKQGISTSGKKGIIDEQKKDVSLSEKERIQLVYIDGKQYIKYVDKEDQVHLVESRDPYKISEIYKSALERIKDPKQFDAKYLFDELTSALGEKPSETIEEINPDYLTSEEVNMIDFIHSNERYKNNLKNDTVRHFKGMNLHAIEETNDIVATTDHDGLIESTHIKDNNIKQDLSTTKVEKPEKEVNKEKELTLDEYEELLAKFANNSDLSLDELRALRHSNVSQGLEEELEEEIEKKTSGPTLSLTGSKYPLAGFIDKYTLTFFIIMTSCIGILVGALLFKTMFFN